MIKRNELFIHLEVFECNKGHYAQRHKKLLPKFQIVPNCIYMGYKYNNKYKHRDHK